MAWGSWVPTANKAATFAEVVAGKRKPSVEQNKCYLLDTLPRGSFFAELAAPSLHLKENLY